MNSSVEIFSGIFKIQDDRVFGETALRIFRTQYSGNETYRTYVDALYPDAIRISDYRQIPFLPILFFRTTAVVTNSAKAEKIFTSSGTTQTEKSRHFVADLTLYRESLVRGFNRFYGPFSDYNIFALTPGPADNPDSSLIFMVGEWIRNSGSALSGFYLNDYPRLSGILSDTAPSGRKNLVIGLNYALLDFAEYFTSSATELVIMETGGMKGKRKEMVRDEFHELMREKFRVPLIHSEYGMTELLSQAYSSGNGIFKTPPWMKILIRDAGDFREILPEGKTGCINIIDLANYNSCSFIATDDLGKILSDSSFEMLGRFDQSTLRGCNLMIG